MNGELDENLVERIDELPRRAISETFHRYATSRRDPLSGAGARAFGGRWNPRDIFGAIYLATPIDACAGEARRAASALATTPETMLEASYLLHTIAVDDVLVLDLTDPEVLEKLGLTLADVADDDWTACQSVGHAAWFLGFQGVLAPSASGAGLVLAAFEGRLELHQLAVKDSVPFTPHLYRSLSGSTVHVRGTHL
ncbi:RES domain-containing protein [Microbacterium endophyticum]|uniref:RES domain-containing protein n=1 Tax=Microbacterium endophyticum TaxID=1526412 RepID=A0A7W4V211_9MICO|nr:RES domain-containing protein [Microbacterium endophyticum]MBB2975094.1 RES domain-containing protein [Microbacterium endophyticum]NIK37366.1 RES domain-containing protein [Microbacterium endophyticum]